MPDNHIRLHGGPPVRDVGRALDMSYAEVDRIAKLIPNALGMTLTKALELSVELKSSTTATRW